jgi:hypothetical protein
MSSSRSRGHRRTSAYLGRGGDARHRVLQSSLNCPRAPPGPSPGLPVEHAFTTRIAGQSSGAWGRSCRPRDLRAGIAGQRSCDCRAPRLPGPLTARAAVGAYRVLGESLLVWTASYAARYVRGYLGRPRRRSWPGALPSGSTWDPDPRSGRRRHQHRNQGSPPAARLATAATSAAASMGLGKCA